MPSKGPLQSVQVFGRKVRRAPVGRNEGRPVSERPVGRHLGSTWEPRPRAHVAPLSPPRFPQKTATAVAHCKRGNGLIKVNGRPLEMIEPRTLQYKVLGLKTGVWVEWRALETEMLK